MTNDLDSQKSYWWSLLSEFGEEVLLVRRVALGITQADMAKRCGIDQSEISRIERGLATPQNIPALNNLCKEYKLNNDHKERFAELVTGTKNPQTYDNSRGISQLLKDQIVFVANLNRSGNPKMAIKQSEIIRTWVNNKATKSIISNNKKIIKQFSLLLLEESAAWWDIAEDENELIMKTKPLLREAFLLDPNNSFYLTNQAFHYYILGKYDKAMDIIPKIIDIKTNDGHNWGIELLRIRTVIAAKIQDLRLFRNLEREIQKQLSSSVVDQINKAYLLEGLGKAYSYIDKKKALSILHESQTLMDSLISNPIFWKIRYVQLARSWMIATKDTPIERKKILKKIEMALQICDQCGFFRHKKQILDLTEN
ncbi:MAG TPA: helix-turn-helix transcriptional regulator [Patescibacteria group bacterium]|nr:helix-turn-helix transcriptional regulator [Patescibacteria group bacterium]